MAEAAGTALARLVSMVHLIDEHPGITTRQLASHFGRSMRRIRADIDTLDRAGFDDLLPDKTFEIDYDLYVAQDRLALRTPLELRAPLPVTEEEFALLLTGLGAAAPLLTDQERQWVPRTISALMAMRAPISKSTAAAPVPLAMESRLRDTVLLFRDAISQGRDTGFHYVSGAGTTSDRIFRPDSLTLGVEGWVVSGFCASAQERRTFRLDRMSGVEMMGRSSFPTIPASDTQAGVARSVEVDLQAQARLLLAESAASSLQVNEDGTITATFTVFDDAWMRKQLLNLAPWVITTRPRTYLEQAASFARTALVEQKQALHAYMGSVADRGVDGDGANPDNEHGAENHE